MIVPEKPLWEDTIKYVCMYVCLYLGEVCVLILPECSLQKKHTARHLVWEYQKRTEPLQMSENSNC